MGSNHVVALAMATILLAAGGFALWPEAAGAVYCGSRIVHRGDTTLEVRRMCGSPTDVTRRVEQRTRSIGRRIPGGGIVYESVTVSVEIQEWIYDLGPTRLMRRFRFEDGRLTAMETLGYGSPE